MARAAAAKGWPATKARVTSSTVETVYGTSGSVFYAPVVRVAYTVDGHPFEASGIHFGSARFFSEDDAGAVAARFHENAEVQVHYDPEDRETAILEFEEGIGARNLWIGIAILLLPFVLAYPLGWWNG